MTTLTRYWAWRGVRVRTIIGVQSCLALGSEGNSVEHLSDPLG
jgi:hypothetical protein